MTDKVQVVNLFLSPEHVFRGHHGGPPGDTPVREVRQVACVAGRGLRGDRYFDHEKDFKGQITFFEEESYHALCRQFGVSNKPASVFRRNVIVRGVRLRDWIGKEFELQGIRFYGVEECRPCAWMDLAFCPGAEAAMRGRGGLRARILSDGELRVDPPPTAS